MSSESVNCYMVYLLPEGQWQSTVKLNQYLSRKSKKLIYNNLLELMKPIMFNQIEAS